MEQAFRDSGHSPETDNAGARTRFESNLPEPASAPRAETIAREFREFVAADSFPCVGSKAALARDAIHIHVLGALGDRGNDALLLDQLGAFARTIEAQDPEDTTVSSFVAIFDGPGNTDELRFEAMLWSQLQRLHDLDARRGVPWAGDVSTRPDRPDFSLSLAGHPFFVIGLHAGASRLARRFPRPVLVFNSHRQFEQLRADGRYEKMQVATRTRDEALQGSINPNLADFGQAAEARQYSGRRVGPDWTCPFHARTSQAGARS